MFKLLFVFLFLIIDLSALQAESQQIIIDEKNQVVNENEVITTIKSKIINVKRKSGKIEFIDNVIVERQDTSLLADRMDVYYSENKENDESAIEEIFAYDNVKIFNQEFVVTGEEGFYDPQLGDFIVEKNVIFNNGTSIAQGKRFVYNVETQKGYLTGDKIEEDQEDVKDEVIENNSNKDSTKDNRVILIISDTNQEDEEEDEDKNEEDDINNKKEN